MVWSFVRVAIALFALQIASVAAIAAAGDPLTAQLISPADISGDG